MDLLSGDPYDRYLQAVADALQKINRESDQYLHMLTLQGRLAQVIAEIRQYGASESARVELARITTELDRVCIAGLGQSYRSMCGLNELPKFEKGRIYHNLPQPDYGRFIGRTNEINKIKKLLRPYPLSNYHIVTIDGVGGVGKSALALEVAHSYLRDVSRLPKEERFEAIIWTSAKQSILTSEGIVQRKQALRTLDDICATALVTLGQGDITQIQVERQVSLLNAILTKIRTLVVVDNLETIDDESVIEWLRELPAPTKAIVTTRYRLDVAYPIRLVGMSWTDASELISSECEKKGVELEDKLTRRLYDRTGGVPLALVWSIAQMGLGYGADTVLGRLGDPKGDIARYCFEGAVDNIKGTDAYRVLMALTCFTPDASRDAVGYVAGIEDRVSRDEALVLLEKLSLVNRASGRFSLLPLTKSFALHELATSGSFEEIAQERWLEFFCRFAVENGGEYWNWKNQEALWTEADNLVRVAEWTYLNERWSSFMQVIRVAIFVLASANRWAEALKWTRRGLEVAELTNDKRTFAWLSIYLGWLLGQQGEYEEAEEYLSLGLQYSDRARDLTAKSIALSVSAGLARRQKRFEEAESLLREARSIAKPYHLDEAMVQVEFESGKLYRDLGQREEAYSAFLAARGYLEEDPAKGFDISVYVAILGNLGYIALQRGSWDEAKDLCLKSLEIFENHGSKQFKAHLQLWIAMAEKGLGNLSSAAYYAEQAASWLIEHGTEDEIAFASKMISNSKKRYGSNAPRRD